MPNGPIRRAQLIAPFGVGAMVVVRDGLSLITAGLDHWYKREDGGQGDIREFKEEEWRLSRQLGVNHFRQPPDFRVPGKDVPNSGMTIPFLRFPQWHSCSRCGRLKKLRLVVRERPLCAACQKDGYYRTLTQVPLIAMCERGHLQDFPWREWVHESVNPGCQQDIRLIATGSATLAGQKVKCGCGKERSLNAVTFENNGQTVLSNALEKGERYLCQGSRPWLGTEEGEPCDCQLRAALRSASNVYYAQTRSAIFVPRGSNNVPADLVAVLESPSLKFLINNFPKSMLTPELLRGGAEVAELIKPFSDEQLRAGLELVLEGVKERVEPKEETDFRREEFNVLRTPRWDEELRIRIADKAYGPDIAQYFSKITLIDKLRETRALVGFTRILPTEQELKDLKRMLRRDPAKASWLPAYVVYGEGIFLEFSEESVQTWLKENASKIAARVNPLIKRYKQVQEERKLRERIISPRFLLVHTFAHLLINRLTFECGYSSAALRERLYISDEPDAPMAGILIYTASGDAEGTMGGLVRMGKPGLLEPVIKKAVEAAQWCSADPVCMEMGRGGQGPDATNLAACHSCSLVPETSCEEFNRFLDRAMIVGELEYRSLGYFSGLLKSSSSE
jgi:hypothetical protein